jgi:hypothetical protein
MVFHKMTDEMEKGGPADMAIMDGLGKRIEDGVKVAESKELIAGYASLNLPSKETAIEWAIRFEVRQMPDR